MSNKHDDRREAKEAAYNGPVSPFPEGTRLHRYFLKARQHVESMDAIFRDMEMVYGPIGHPRS